MDYLQEANDAFDYYCMFVKSLSDQCLWKAIDSAHLRGDLSMTFGMGTVSITYCGVPVMFDGLEPLWSYNPPSDRWMPDEDGYEDPVELDEIARAISIIEEMTDNYKHGCPEDVTVDFDPLTE